MKMTRLDVHTLVLVVLPALLVCLACGSNGGGDKSASAIATVSREVPASNPAGISSSDLATTRIPRGDGVVVYVKDRKTPRFVWVVLDGQAYACNRETKSLTPAVPYASDARWDTWKRTGLDPANTAAFVEIVNSVEARKKAP
jgi:hypothetical protein